ncbi:replicative DNA helicase [Streptomyces sp. NPDC006992]|uniref:replicative DNA helicase n=1 Tax=Streptomyces sp. NPDC006992 TaxID=3155601 RepID=UPI0033DAFF51
MSVPTQAPPGDDGGQEDVGRVPPQDLEAERSVLGSMMLSKDAISDVVQLLTPADFYRPAHETIWRAIVDLDGQGEPADPITVTAELTRRGELARCGGPGFVQALVQAVPTAANAEYYAEIVHERAVLRRLVEAGTRITQMGYAAEGELAEVVDAAEAEVMAVSDGQEDDSLQLFSAGYDTTIDRVQEAGRKKDSLTGVPTGFMDLDSLTSGWQPGQLVMIAGRPAMGKTTAALDSVRAASLKHGLTSVFFSLEMGREEIHHRVTSAEARVALHHLRTGQLDDDAWMRVARHQPRLSAAPLYVDDSPQLTMMTIRAKARRLKQRVGLDLVVVDYLQLMQYGGRRHESRQEEISVISRGLKLLAKELHVPVIALSQLNRGPEQRTDKKPMVSDLRESGSLEQDADIVILLHREDAYEKDSPRSGEADLIVGKHRNGPTATVTVAFQGHYSRFVDMASTDT